MKPLFRLPFRLKTLPLIGVSFLFCVAPASAAQNDLVFPDLTKEGASTDLYVKFREIVAPSFGATNQIWTRSYVTHTNTKPSIDTLIPGPTLEAQPGGLLDVKLHNLLTKEELKLYDTTIDKTVPRTESKDEAGNRIIYHELNVPHNPENTNLHVHGLHVDPSKDDVTIVLLPAGSTDKGSYTDPDSIGESEFSEKDVSDRPVIVEQHKYAYKIPEGHLPGTHWYHAHKHGSTALQTENGMAGAIIMRGNPKSKLGDLDPLTDPKNASNRPSTVEDRVMIVQGLLNYGLQFGTGKSQTKLKGQVKKNGGTPSIQNTAPVLTLNGIKNPHLTVGAGAWERWRLLNATANHRSMGYFWLGFTTNGGTNYHSVPMYAIARDGITLRKKMPVTAENPILLAPGNRVDLLVQLNEANTLSNTNSYYTLFKNIPSSNVPTNKLGFEVLSKYVRDEKGNQLPNIQWLADGPRFNPFMFNDNDKGLSYPTRHPFSQRRTLDPFWSVYGAGSNTLNTNVNHPIVPLLQGEKLNNGRIGVRTAPRYANGSYVEPGLLYPLPTQVGWQPAGDSQSGTITGQAILTVDTTGAASSSVKQVSKFSVAKYSPQSLYANTKDSDTKKLFKYVWPIADADIHQSRAVVFDLSAVTLNVLTNAAATNHYRPIRQFTINGRVFGLNDYIGANKKPSADIENSHNAEQIIRQSAGLHLTNFLADVKDPAIGFNFMYQTREWKAQDSYVNPGYYRPLRVVGTQGATKTPKTAAELVSLGLGLNYSAPTTGLWPNGAGRFPEYTENHYPNYQSVTGLRDVSVVQGTQGAAGPPVNKTAEEWLLINNSDIGHPFHIHINPFFVTEIGQLTRGANTNGLSNLTWKLNKMTWDEKTQSVNYSGPVANEKQQSWQQGNVGVWLDTILVPPRGYVKVRFWVNVPHQTQFQPVAEGPILYSVEDDSNEPGIWVFHCHILRHEDRGMMMVVATEKNKGAGEADQEARVNRRRVLARRIGVGGDD